MLVLDQHDFTRHRQDIGESRIAAGRTCSARSLMRADRARIEAELFHGRYHLSSKNDDDLPLVR